MRLGSPRPGSTDLADGALSSRRDARATAGGSPDPGCYTPPRRRSAQPFTLAALR